MVPTGSEPEVVDRYYDYLFERAIDAIEVGRTGIAWSGPILRLVVWGVVLGVFFYLFSTRLWWQYRSTGELYAPVWFGGAILERIGKVSTFAYWVWGSITAWGISFIIRQIIHGQIY